MQTNARSRGFTIVEFMIATVVFSVVLLGVTAAIMEMTKKYQRALYESRTQSVTSTIVQAISQSIRYNHQTNSIPRTSFAGNTVGYCIGNNKAFYFTIGRRFVDKATAGPTEARSGFIVEQGGACDGFDMVGGSGLSEQTTELLGQDMRIAKLDINPLTGPSGRGTYGANTYTITVRVIYGEDDLLCNSDSTCRRGARVLTESEILTGGDLRCKADVGSEYCTVNELTTVVQSGL